MKAYINIHHFCRLIHKINYNLTNDFLRESLIAEICLNLKSFQSDESSI